MRDRSGWMLRNELRGVQKFTIQNILIHDRAYFCTYFSMGFGAEKDTKCA